MTNDDLPNNIYKLSQGEFGAILGNPWVYWIKGTIRDIFLKNTPLESVVNPKTGLATADNVRFLRYIWEIPLSQIGIYQNSQENAANSLKHWFPYMKGGGVRKWYGNQTHLLNWFANAKEIRAYERSAIRNPNYYFMEGITWSDLSSRGFGVRYLPFGFIFDMKGSSGFPEIDQLFTLMAVMNSPWMNYALVVSHAEMDG